ncbi:hypothetical protein HWV62_43295, partial [Athelia sp. TMB]
FTPSATFDPTKEKDWQANLGLHAGLGYHENRVHETLSPRVSQVDWDYGRPELYEPIEATPYAYQRPFLARLLTSRFIRIRHVRETFFRFTF